MSNQEELIQYYIVNEDLIDKNNQPVKMSAGKLAAQVAHVATEIAFNMGRDFESNFRSIDAYLFDEYLHDDLHKKILLRAHIKTINRMTSDINVGHLCGTYTEDAGLTELKEGQVTVIGLFPRYKSDLPSYIQRLQLYRG